MFELLTGTIAGLLTPRARSEQCEVTVSRVTGGVRLDYEDGDWVVLPAEVVAEIAAAAGYTEAKHRGET